MQNVIKGIGGIERVHVDRILNEGILCRWWQNIGQLPINEVPKRLTERNLAWHQNRYNDPDPDDPNNESFCEHTPFISTTAGTVERDTYLRTNIIQSAWLQAMQFASDNWTRDGYLFYCYLFILGVRSVEHEQFSEEIRELNIYTRYSPFQPEGEITAKISIPPRQIAKAEYWPIDKFFAELNNGQLPEPADVIENPLFISPEEYKNIRDFLV